MARHTFSLAGRSFASASELKAHVRELIARSPLYDSLGGWDAEEAIRDEMACAYRDGIRDGATCSITGKPLVVGEIHVDHVPPFAERLTAFCEWRGVDVDCVQTIPIEGGGGRKLADESLIADWQKYHRESGTLRVVSVEAHKALTAEQARKRHGGVQ